MLDHIFLTVSDLARSVAFYEQVLPRLEIAARHDYDGADGPPGHPDLKGFGAEGRVFFWLRQGTAHPGAAHVGFLAHSCAEVDAAYAAAMVAGATDNVAAGGAPGSACIMIRAIMRPMCLIRTDTAWNSFIRTGSTGPDPPPNGNQAGRRAKMPKLPITA